MLPDHVDETIESESQYPLILANKLDGYVDHILHPKSRDAFCSNASTIHAQNEIRTIEEYVEENGLETLQTRPESVCKRCWSALSSYNPSNQFTNTSERKQPKSTLQRWKVPGYARRVWCDILVPDHSPLTDLQGAISTGLTLRDEYHGYAFSNHDRLNAGKIEILRPEMYHHHHSPEIFDASEIQCGEVFELFHLGQGDRFHYIYDFGTPSRAYGIIKERVGSHQDTTEYEYQFGDVLLLQSNEPRPSRY